MSGKVCEANRSTKASSRNWAWPASPRAWPGHVVRLTDFLRHRAVVRTHACRRIAGHSREVRDRADSFRATSHAHGQIRDQRQRSDMRRASASKESNPACLRACRAWSAAHARRSGSARPQRLPNRRASRLLRSREPRRGDIHRNLGQTGARDSLVAAAEAVVERDFLATKEALHLRDVARKILARRRSLANLGDCGITATDPEYPRVHRTPPARSRSPTRSPPDAASPDW